MKTIEQKFQDKIEVERLWVITEQAEFILLGVFPLPVLMIYGLWNTVSNSLLLWWFLLHTASILLLWWVICDYKNRKDELKANNRTFKRLLLFGCALTGLIWVLGMNWFLVPSEPTNIFIISLTLFIHIAGGVAAWYCYWPSLIAFAYPPTLFLIAILINQGEKIYTAIGLIFLVVTVNMVLASIKFAKQIEYVLRLNFENATLRKESEEKSLLLAKALAEAEQANAAKTRFLAAASHDLRQPIHALGLFFAELSDRVYSQDTALVISQVEDSIAAINSMLNALLDVSKLDAGVVKPNIEPFALAELFSRLQTEFLSIALENQNEIRIRPTSATVSTDPAMLERMLRNLIGNALRYTANGRILVSARRRGKNIAIQVFDTGSGIPESQLDEIFVEFHQLHNPARDRRQGLGLGLAIVKRLAKLLRHEIRVVSRVGRGSCFTVTLPLARDTKGITSGGRQSAQAYLPGNPLAGCHALVLDDDIAILEGMKGLLTRWGCVVTTASSLDEAMIKIEATTQHPELLIIDYRLPNNTSGIEVAHTIQSHLAYPVAVLIITGDTGPDRLREAEVSGYPLLHKPVEPAKLRSTMQFLITKLKRGNA